MKKITFDEEELYAIAVFHIESREKAIASMEKVLGLMDDDPEMKALIVSVKEKLKRISDKDFKELDVERYIEELEEEDEEEESAEEDGAGGNDSSDNASIENSNGEEDAT
jgi:glutamyl/glutaminyl-tRNA synthetase